MPDIVIVEVGPRDGLQNNKRLIPAAEKIALIDLLSRAGFQRIEATSFVSPKWVPQMADAAEVMAGITRAPGVRYEVLTPNLKGYEAARAARADKASIFASASEGFSRANLNCTIAESLERYIPVMEAARADGIPVRGTVSVVTDCPFDGPTPPENVARVAAALRDLGCFEISLGDTIGQGRPETIDAMLAAVLEELPPEQLAGHYHDTAGRALQNIDASIARGLRVFDAAVGGLGGCPYAPGAEGNVATEKVAAHLAAQGFETGLDMALLQQAAAMAQRMRG
ncbi:MAG TPA: hydroxymethylglutaryl-CoA lyase [Paracoccus solventivorans]|uniref:Hydroxymethylglutaryl-CoA lyase n=1 Tax=Paracoccus solventivorans TaxID=53463 RepID=A0A832QX64_9RHOB|nr:hydroxymethylglutaryl-CoA lyase [Paracoccus solventivorans]HHW34636.1 hydroxymethylglutaryl-CoA lyase [Paracoccus solventivorans]